MTDAMVPSVIKRFNDTGYTVTPGPLDSPCWIWNGSVQKSRGGYGQLNDRGKVLRVHRLSYQIHVGQIPDGQWILHRCDTPPCINPKHLYPGTVGDNVKDMVTRGRNVVPDGPRGSTHHSAKLTEDDVDEIRASTEGAVSLAKKYGVRRQVIWRIRTGQSWKR